MNTPQLYVTLACFGFVSGVYVGWVPGAFYILATLVVVVAAGVWGVTHKTHAALGVVVVCLSFLLGVQRMVNANAQFRATRDELRAVSSSTVWQGVVVTDRDEREKDAQVDVQLMSVHSEDGVPRTLTHAPVVRLTVPLHTVVSYADRVEVHGTVTFPETFTEEDGRIFDYGAYLRAQGVVAEMRYVSVIQLCTGQDEQDTSAPTETTSLKSPRVGDYASTRLFVRGISVGAPETSCVHTIIEKLFSFLYNIKLRFKTALQRVVHEPYAALALGLVVGEKHGLTKEEMATFTTTGLSHIVVLSGFNITIIIVLAFRLLSFLPRRSTYVVGMLLAVLFVAMTGFSSTAVRALLMASIVVVGKMLYRSSIPLVSLMVVSLGMVVWSPYILRDGLGWVQGDPSTILF
jgi:competence protein ComEC